MESIPGKNEAIKIFRRFPKDAGKLRFKYVVYDFEDHVYGKEVIGIQNFPMEKGENY